MAKRGYRGKHPYNDMKVSKHSNQNTGKSHPKLKKQYNKLKHKQKYPFIRDHEGFYPQGTMVISSSKDFVAASEITMSGYRNDSAFLTLNLKGRAGVTQTGNKLFQTNDSAQKASEGIRDNVNTHLAGVISASATSVAGGACSATDCVANLTAVLPGPDTAFIELGTVNVANTVTFNGIGASNSGSAGPPVTGSLLSFIGG